MKNILLCFFLLGSLCPTSLVEAAGTTERAAFTRYNSLWLYQDKTETLIHENMTFDSISWSFDGEWLAYEATPLQTQVKEKEIWLYNVSTKNKLRLKIQGHHPVWNPREQTLAFLSNSILCVVELSSNIPVVHQLTGGVSTFSWDGKGVNLLASASAVLFPDGWSHPRLYEVHWGIEKEKQELDVKVSPVHTISSPLTYQDTSILAVEAKHFSWSDDGKNLALIVTPTDSWSKDSNMLSVLVKENKLFLTLGEILLEEDWVKWAPKKPILASIQGKGHLSNGVKNKVLTTQSIIPNYKQTHTPDGFVDVGFDWLDDSRIVVARGRETENASEKFVSSLHIVTLKEKKTAPLVSLPEGFSDSAPHVVENGQQVAWVREDDGGRKAVWMSGMDGGNTRKVIGDVFEVVWFGR